MATTIDEIKGFLFGEFKQAGGIDALEKRRAGIRVDWLSHRR